MVTESWNNDPVLFQSSPSQKFVDISVWLFNVWPFAYCNKVGLTLWWKGLDQYQHTVNARCVGGRGSECFLQTNNLGDQLRQVQTHTHPYLRSNKKPGQFLHEVSHGIPFQFSMKYCVLAFSRCVSQREADASETSVPPLCIHVASPPDSMLFSC